MTMPRRVFLALLLIGLSGRAATAGLFHKNEGTPPPGRPRVIEHTHERAGWPLEVANHAYPTNTPEYSGGYIGGGTACGGSPRFREEGTWGWDYQGHYLPRRVWLSWTHGRRYQGGTGAYRTDGPGAPRLHLHGTDAGH